MSEKNTKKVDCNAPRTSPLFSWALCGMTGREKSEDKPRNIKTIKTSPMTLPDSKGFKPIKKEGGRRRKRKTRRKRKSRRKRKTRRRRKKRKTRRKRRK